MKAIVIYNEESGFGELSAHALKELLRAEGYQAVYCTLQDERFPKILQEACDMVLAVGGDGTVKTVIREMAGSDTPVRIWPAGTSNNIAASCGVVQRNALNSTPAIIHRIHLPKCMLEGEELLFAESVGIGLLANLMREMKYKVGYRNREEKINNSLMVLKKLLKECREYEVELLLDGERYNGKYLAVEVMNTRLAGPKLLLAPEADLSDGLLDVVLISGKQAMSMESYLTDRLAGLQRPPGLPVYRAKEIEIRGKGLDYHLDDDFNKSTGLTSIKIYGDNSWVYVL
jgi:diacylglycerol kinase (ATP)